MGIQFVYLVSKILKAKFVTSNLLLRVLNKTDHCGGGGGEGGVWNRSTKRPDFSILFNPHFGTPYSNVFSSETIFCSVSEIFPFYSNSSPKTANSRTTHTNTLPCTHIIHAHTFFNTNTRTHSLTPQSLFMEAIFA